MKIPDDNKIIEEARRHLMAVDWKYLTSTYGPEAVGAMVSDISEVCGGRPLHVIPPSPLAKGAYMVAALRSLADSGITFGFRKEDPWQRAAGVVRFAANMTDYPLSPEETDLLVESLAEDRNGALTPRQAAIASVASQLLIALAALADREEHRT